VTRRQLPDLAEDRERARDDVEGEIRLQRVEVDLAARKRAHLGGELELVARGAVREGLYPEAVARQEQAPPT
jgi:hypothetical protein